MVTFMPEVSQIITGRLHQAGRPTCKLMPLRNVTLVDITYPDTDITTMPHPVPNKKLQGKHFRVSSPPSGKVKLQTYIAANLHSTQEGYSEECHNLSQPPSRTWSMSTTTTYKHGAGAAI